MARQMANPYAGNYAPSGLRMTKAELVNGLKGIKVKAPNRKLSSQSYKSGLRKENASQGTG